MRDLSTNANSAQSSLRERLATASPRSNGGSNGKSPGFSRELIAGRIAELGKWFHNLELQGVSTAPNHFLWDYPACKWTSFRDAIPHDLTGKSVLDIGCNAGFYSQEMKRRGAYRVVGLDFDERYLAQARFAAEVNGLEIEFRRLSVYEVGLLGEQFDLVLFMGVFYHLRHPLLALDLIHEHVAKDLFVFQSMQRGSSEVAAVGEDYDFWQTELFDQHDFPKMHFIEHRYSGDPTNWWIPNRACVEALLRSSGFAIEAHPEDEVYVCRRVELPAAPDGPRAVYPPRGGRPLMVEAVMLWNEPNNKSHWDLAIDPEWLAFSNMLRLGGDAVASISPGLPRVLGGISPIDPCFITRLQEQGGLDNIDVVAVHGFPLDWNHWQIHDWPSKLDEIRAVTDKPIWVSEVGVSTFGAEEVQEFGLRRTSELLVGKAPRIHWYSLFDLPRAWPATTRHRESEGSSYYRHFYMGLIREDGTPKPSLRHLADYTPEVGLCQWFHYEDHRLDEAVRWMRDLGVTYLRTGISWADVFRPNALEWFDRQMAALEEFQVTVTFCFTPEHRGVTPHYTSPPQEPQEFADFCAWMVSRYAQGTSAAPPKRATTVDLGANGHHGGSESTVEAAVSDPFAAPRHIR